MSKKAKFYVVWVGQNPGVYSDWSSCQSQIAGFPGAKYKSFNSRQEAEIAYQKGPKSYQKKSVSALRPNQIIIPSISVDAACSGNPGVTEYQGVITDSKKLLFHGGPFPGGSNNLGEFLGLVHGISFLQKKGHPNLPIYTDSKTAMSWLRKKKVNTTISRTGRNAEIFVLVDRAEKWIQTHSWQNPILKWDTVRWGEIPADFGRK